MLLVLPGRGPRAASVSRAGSRRPAAARCRGAGLAHEFVGQDEARVAEIGEGQAHNPLLALLHVGQLDPDHVAFGAADEAAETLAAVEGAASSILAS